MKLRVFFALVASAVLAAGCATQGQTGAAWGSGIGALAGNLIGGNTTGTLVGAAVGSGIGYLIGNERDKEEARNLSDQNGTRNYEHAETGPLGGTRWELVDWSPRERGPNFRTKTVEFLTSGRVVTNTTFHDGRSEREDETYRVVGNTLIVNKPGYLANYRFRIDGSQLTIDTDQVRALLRRA